MIRVITQILAIGLLTALGRTEPGKGVHTFLDLNGNPEGAVSRNKKVFGTYLHGLFDSGDFRRAFLSSTAIACGIDIDDSVERKNTWMIKDENYEKLAEHFSRYCDVDGIIQVMGL